MWNNQVELWTLWFSLCRCSFEHERTQQPKQKNRRLSHGVVNKKSNTKPKTPQEKVAIWPVWNNQVELWTLWFSLGRCIEHERTQQSKHVSTYSKWCNHLRTILRMKMCVVDGSYIMYSSNVASHTSEQTQFPFLKQSNYTMSIDDVRCCV